MHGTIRQTHTPAPRRRSSPASPTSTRASARPSRRRRPRGGRPQPPPFLALSRPLGLAASAGAAGPTSRSSRSRPSRTTRSATSSPASRRSTPLHAAARRGASGAGREPRRPADEDRRQPAAPGSLRPHGRVRAGRHPRPVQPRPRDVGQVPRRHGEGLPRSGRTSTASPAARPTACSRRRAKGFYVLAEQIGVARRAAHPRAHQGEDARRPVAHLRADRHDRSAQGGGDRLRAEARRAVRFDKADRILALDSDFLGSTRIRGLQPRVRGRAQGREARRTR